MTEQLLAEPAMKATEQASKEGDGPFCPECGQSLDFARHEKEPVKRRTLEPFVFLIFGLCLTVAFGLRTWDAHLALPSLEQHIAALSSRAPATDGDRPRPGNPSMVVADTMGEVLEEQLDLRLAFQRGITGLGLGLFTIVVGAMSWLRESPELVAEQRKR